MTARRSLSGTLLLAIGIAAILSAKGVENGEWRNYSGQYLYALNPKTGEPIPTFGAGGKVDLNVGLPVNQRAYSWASTPLVVRDVVIMGSAMPEQDSANSMDGPPGDVRAFDVRTG